MRYSVFFKNGKTVQVIADEITSNYDNGEGYIRFSLGSRDVAIFSFKSIIGFLQEEGSDTE